LDGLPGSKERIDLMQLHKDKFDLKDIAYIIRFMSNKSQVEAFESVVDVRKVSKKIKEKINNTTTRFNNLRLPINMTFGVEIEFEDIDHSVVALLSKATIDIQTDEWDIKPDTSLSNGAEIASPPLSDDKRCWCKLSEVCSFIDVIGGSAKMSCGGHIHFGVDYLGTDSKAWDNLFRIWAEVEPLIYKISNPEGEVSRESINKNAGSVAGYLQDMLEKGSVNISPEEGIKNLAMQISGGERGYGINLRNLFTGSKPTIEFRIPNGTVDYEEIRHNVLLFGKLLQVSKEMSERQAEGYKSEEFKALLESRLKEEEKLDRLLTLLFDSEEERKIFRRRWDSVKDKKSPFIITGELRYIAYATQDDLNGLADDEATPTIITTHTDK